MIYSLLWSASSFENYWWGGGALHHKTLCDKHSSTKMPQSKALHIYKRKGFLLILHYRILTFTNENLESMKKKNKRKKLPQLIQRCFLKNWSKRRLDCAQCQAV